MPEERPCLTSLVKIISQQLQLSNYQQPVEVQGNTSDSHIEMFSAVADMNTSELQ